MSQQLKRVFLGFAAAFTAWSASAFSMMGPPADWQVERIGYQLPGDIGGVMNLGEKYRWNVKTIYYAYDQSFLQYFGVQGTNAVEKAFAILNALPSASQMSPDLSEFPLDTRRVNYVASALGIQDLMSVTLDTMLEHLGLAEPERYVWALRARTELGNPRPTNYTVIKRNFDPVTIEPSSFVNGVLYTYAIAEFQNPDVADAVEIQADPLQVGFTAVAAGFLGSGEYYTGLTRDDMGGLRHLYGSTNPLEHWHVETLLPETTGPTTSSPWNPIGGTNVVSTNSIVSQALRPGVEKITFKQGKYDSLLGAFIVVTNTWEDTYISGGIKRKQNVQRVVAAPDVLLVADDLGLTTGGFPVLFRRTDTSGWINNDAINGATTLPGPGVISPTATFSYSKVGPYFMNQDPFLLDESAVLFPGVLWGHFDGTTNAPIIFPSGSSIQSLKAEAIYGNYGSDGSPWTVPNIVVTTNSTAGTAN